MMNEDNPYIAGPAAFHAGKSRDANPYQHGSLNWLMWDDAYSDEFIRCKGRRRKSHKMKLIIGLVIVVLYVVYKMSSNSF
jgi:hypothetical protein